jgi:beta-glucanase (GH16 family)
MILKFVLGVVVLASLRAQDSPPASPWRVVWQDEFDRAAGTAPDPAKWTYDLGQTGWGNAELQTYTKSTDNAFHDGQGHLVIQAIATPGGGYTSARLKTQGLASFTYGRVEGRMKLPSGQGIWPAFWMLGAEIRTAHWPGCGEIDIMENIGKEPATVHGTIHGPGYSGGNGIGAPYTLQAGRFADGFHVFAVEWQPDQIQFFVDGAPYKRITPAGLPPGTAWVFDRPLFLLLNLAVGGRWPGNPDAGTPFPQRLIVDYVRVYERPLSAGGGDLR